MQYEPSTGGGRRRRGAPPTACTCPSCGYETEKVAGVPCRSMTCPKCGSPLVGK